VILVRNETTPDDVHGMIAARGVLTARGGKTSHTAVVARGMGKPCVAGAESLKVDLQKKLFTVSGTTVKEGDLITINGSTGDVILGSVPMIEPAILPHLDPALAHSSWARFMRLQNASGGVIWWIAKAPTWLGLLVMAWVAALFAKRQVLRHRPYSE